MALDEPGYGYLPKPRKPRRLPGQRIPLPGGGSIPLVDTTLPAAAQTTLGTYTPPVLDWRGLIESDPGYLQDLANITGGSAADRQRTLAALRSALVQFGGSGLQGVAGQLDPGWGDLLDPTTLGAAGAADTSGTSVASQLAKAHSGRNLAIQDQLAARGILSSGQTGYELGEERQRNTIAQNDAVQALLGFLREGIGGYSGREYTRGQERSAAAEAAAARVAQFGLTPPTPANPVDALAKIIRGQTSKKTKARTGRPTGLVQ
jgi:hypothetical protein